MKKTKKKNTNSKIIIYNTNKKIQKKIKKIY